ncbi:MAG TPA: hypothetical protein VMS02_01675 [Solirubrobacteraceae bacterium]|nr:hypothetical protein [Solirubrobacteraceae bacterium]
MSLAGVLVACWLTLAALAFMALTALGRFAARGDGEAELGILGDAEVRMMLSDREDARLPLDARLAAYMGIPGGSGAR